MQKLESFKKGCVVKITNVQSEEEFELKKYKEQIFGQFGPVAFIEYPTGDDKTTMYVRFKEPEAAQKCKNDFTEKKFGIGGKNPSNFEILQGEEEEKYLLKQIEDQEQQQQKKGKKRKGQSKGGKKKKQKK